MRTVLEHLHQVMAARPVKTASGRKQTGRLAAPGVRGWMLLFCLSLIVFNPIIIAIMMVTGFYNNLDAVLDPCMAILGIYIGVQLWKMHPNSVENAKIYLLVFFGVSVFSTFIPIYWMSHYENKLSFSIYEGMKLIGELLFFSIWYAYLNRSKWVKSTYISKRKRHKKRYRRSRGRHRRFPY